MAASDRVELTDLDVFARYSLAVRTATADRDELVATLRSDLAWLEDTGRRPAGPTAVPHHAAAPAPAAPRKTAVRKTAAAKKTTTRKTAATPARKTAATKRTTATRTRRS